VSFASPVTKNEAVVKKLTQKDIAPALEVVEYHTRSLFNETKIYGGVPTSEVDANWQDLVDRKSIDDDYFPQSRIITKLINPTTAEGTFKLSKEEVVQQLGKSPDHSVHFSEDKGGDYIGFLEVFHQLHCTV
jgi:hypothetical protein